ncbi:hypothetical protein, partial [Pseudomonas sp. GW460-R15]|uniref:hypothetical protein n=1 Tax=Pseudomonas sp. GW460-R15 TaxID=2075557 RepID=UPI001C461761
GRAWRAGSLDWTAAAAPGRARSSTWTTPTRSEIETLREKLDATRRESLTDALTGLANRKHFEETPSNVWKVKPARAAWSRQSGRSG